jgi:hypothetical protein
MSAAVYSCAVRNKIIDCHQTFLFNLLCWRKAKGPRSRQQGRRRTVGKMKQTHVPTSDGVFMSCLQSVFKLRIDSQKAHTLSCSQEIGCSQNCFLYSKILEVCNYYCSQEERDMHKKMLLYESLQKLSAFRLV